MVPMRFALVAVLALAAAVAQTGLIAFVGLAAPHLVRSVVKTTHARLIWLSSLMGGVLLMAADVLARWVSCAARAAGRRTHCGARWRLPAVADAPGHPVQLVSCPNSIAAQASGIRARLGNVEILHDVTLALPAARWTSVVGPNGAGKSTLLKVLAQLLPCTGQVELLGQPLAGLPSPAPSAWPGLGKTRPRQTI